MGIDFAQKIDKGCFALRVDTQNKHVCRFLSCEVTSAANGILT